MAMGRPRVRWRRGDLGRFEVEDPNAPRFEIVGVNREGDEVTVWYGGQETPTTIPLKTFRKDCVNWWVTTAVKDPPAWVQPGVTISITGHRFLTQAKVADGRLSKGAWQRNLKNKSFQHEQVDIGKALLVVRSIRKDYASCLMPATGQLILVPLKIIEENGHLSRSKYAVLSGGDDPFETDPLDDIDDLFCDGPTS